VEERRFLLVEDVVEVVVDTHTHTHTHTKHNRPPVQGTQPSINASANQKHLEKVDQRRKEKEKKEKKTLTTNGDHQAGIINHSCLALSPSDTQRTHTHALYFV